MTSKSKAMTVVVKKKLNVVICWHMHQPEYRDLQTGEYNLPWTYLHVIKDYVDMVAHLEANPEAKVVVNFAPILLEQIEDYASQINSYLHDRIVVSDPLLAALVNPVITSDPDERLVIIKNCLRANRERLINRYPPFQKLADMVDWLEANPEGMQYINPQFVADILVWYHLSWMGETVKLTDPRVKRLIDKGSNYTQHERFEIIEIIGDIFSKLICRYRNLAKNGQIELSVTPYAHPIMPLMLDINSTHQAMPDAPLPELEAYPGGEQRVKWHLDQGIATFERFFGFKPRGCWPSEGSVSEKTLKLLSEFGFDWVASGGNVLRNSLRRSEMDGEIIHQPFRVNNTQIIGFYRDDGLSDLIGFEYSNWHADDAVADLIQHLQNIAEHEPDAGVVSIILDGENAWEHYPENGFHFLNALYKQLSQHPDIELTTFSECLDSHLPVKELPHLIAGSWVYGTFSTWIGDTDKNRGWDMLGDVKKCFDKVVASGRLSKKKLQVAENQLAVCEGSDWFWWFGDYNPSEAVSNFEKQFRLNLSNLYQLLGEEVPAYLSLTFTQGSGDPAMGGAMRPGAFENV
jgi:alpha-amylase/alpha-mannosidase (GH57 family)